MQLSAIFLLAVGLAMDATAVAAARGTTVRRIEFRHMCLVGGLFGGFQALMPWLGWMLGHEMGPFVQAWDHWIVFVMLTTIGIHMLWEAQGVTEDQNVSETPDSFGLKVMSLLAIATSIDAFAAGITLPMLHAPLGLSILIIGVTTAILSVAGLLAGRYFGAVLGKRLGIVGGLILIGLGFKILLEHLKVI